MSLSSFIAQTAKDAAQVALERTAQWELMDSGITKDKQKEAAYATTEAKAAAAAMSTYGAIDNKRLVKAALIPRGEGTNSSSITPIRFMFNPTEVSFSRDLNLNNMSGARTMTGLPKVSFAYVEPYSVSIAGVIFDTFELGTSVLPLIQPLRDAMDFTKFSIEKTYSQTEFTLRGTKAGLMTYATEEYDDYSTTRPITSKRPPVYYFMWGANNYLTCFVQKLSYKLTLFLPNGDPVRAVVDLTLQEVDLRPANREYSAPQKLTGS